MSDSLTILIPVYDEENCIQLLVLELNKFLDQVSIPTGVLFINDGSTDGGLDLIEQICLDDDRYSFISLAHNSGLSTALKAGIDHCKTSLIGYMDADIQTSPLDFLKLLPYADEYALVTGYRVGRKDTVVKKLSSLLANSFRQWLLEDDIIDTGCPLKIMQATIAKQLPFFKGMHRFIPDAVILLGGKVKQVPVQHFPRFAGKSKYNLLNRSFGPLIAAIVFRWMQRNAIHYHIQKYSENL